MHLNRGSKILHIGRSGNLLLHRLVVLLTQNEKRIILANKHIISKVIATRKGIVPFVIDIDVDRMWSILIDKLSIPCCWTLMCHVKSYYRTVTGVCAIRETGTAGDR